MQRTSVSSCAFRALGIAIVSVGLSACVVHDEPPAVAGYATVYADDEVPVAVDVYPHVAFEGGYAYYIRDGWYYRRGDRWLRLRQEPPELRRYRTTYVQRAPPARRYESPRREAAPPAFGYPPPAERVH